jgi:phospholipid/cholesterol/gamma-HCH transport system substrate-binding protein
MFWRRGRSGRVLAAVVAAAVIAAGVLIGLATTGSAAQGHLVAYFPQAIGLYDGNAVDVMGVKIGTVDSLTDVGDQVRADITYDASQKLPADVRAVLVTPSVVSDRYIQLTPAYTGGPSLPDNAVLQQNRTAVPLEYDDIFRNLDTLNQALGPNGANKHGALSRLIKVSDENLHGNGAELNSALKNFGQAIATLAGSRGNLFGTVSHLQQFTTTLANDDGGVRALNRNLQAVGTQLAGERHNLGAALANLSTALRQVNTFVAANRQGITTDLHQATTVTQSLTAEKQALIQVLDDAPIAVGNLSLAGDPKARTLDTKADISYGVTPGAICQTLFNALSGVPGLGGLLGGNGNSLCKKTSGGGLPGGLGSPGGVSGLTHHRTLGPGDGLSQLLSGLGGGQ